MLTASSRGSLTLRDPYHKLQKMDPTFNVVQSPSHGSVYPELEPLDALNEAEARCEELEHINLDLEQRLENHATECMNLEKDIAEERRRWKKKLAAEENKIIKLRDISNRERKMKQNADDRLRRAEMEIYHILQKKYDIVKEAKAQVKKEMLDSDKIKKDLGIRDRILSQARHITAGTSSSKARHISTPKNGSSEESSPEETRSVQAMSVLVDFFAL
eukprot:172127_1